VARASAVTHLLDSDVCVWLLRGRREIRARVALAYGLVVATGNVREFARVPGLGVEEWAA